MVTSHDVYASLRVYYQFFLQIRRSVQAVLAELQYSSYTHETFFVVDPAPHTAQQFIFLSLDIVSRC